MASARLLPPPLANLRNVFFAEVQSGFVWIPDAQKIGEGRLSVFLADVYDAELFANNQNSIAQNKPPYALTLSYLRPLKSETIAKRSAKEMRNIGLDDELKIAAWHEKMRKIFPDVKDGSSITGIYTADKQTIFLSKQQ